MVQKARESPNGCVEMHGDTLTDSSLALEKNNRLWSIILAGGSGERINGLVRRWMGRPIPKQYCAFVGTRSMLQHTLDRAASLGRPEHQLIVIAKSHQTHAEFQLADRPPETVIVQPENRDTLPGILLPLTQVYARDSDATVVIYPSDHFIYPENKFMVWIAGTVSAVEELPDRISLIGIPAASPELEYGWISPGPELWRKGGYSLYTAKHFMEKPSPAIASILMAHGCLWNTMILAAKARTLWKLGWKHFPETMRLFERQKDAIGTSRETVVRDAIYQDMPVQNFSADLLARATDRVAVMPMEGILWSDWGRAERIAETLRRIGKQPNFPMILAGDSRIATASLRQNNSFPPLSDGGGALQNPHRAQRGG
jgi:mannose-1-phosphate guanylyltransferase